MPLQIDTPGIVALLRFPRIPVCPQCGDTLLAPDQTEFHGRGAIHHFWSCDGCGCECETFVDVTSH